MSQGVRRVGLDGLTVCALTWPWTSSKVGARSLLVEDWRVKLRESAVDALHPVGRGRSLQQLRLVVERAWDMGDPSGQVSTHHRSVDVSPVSLLVKVAGSIIRDRGDRLELAWERSVRDDVASSHDPAFDRWRELSLGFPEGILLAAFAAGRPQGRVMGGHGRPRLDVLPVPLQSFREQGWTETHLHLGTSGRFVDQVRGMLERAVPAPSGALGSKGRSSPTKEPSLDDAPLSTFNLAMTALAELFLSLNLDPDGALREPEGLVSKAWLPVWRDLADWTNGVRTRTEGIPSITTRIRVLGLVKGGVYAPGRILENSPVFAGYRSAPSVADQSHLLWSACFRLLESPFREGRGADSGEHGHEVPWGGSLSAPGLCLRMVAMQYLRSLVRIHRELVQQPGTAGLDWFQQYYHRASFGRASTVEVLTRNALRDPCLRACELRTSPGPTRGVTRSLLLAFGRGVGRARADREASRDRRVEAGLILHLRKPDPRAHHASRRRPPHFRSWYREALAMTRSVVGLLQSTPQALYLLRGFDVAGAELSAPLWPVVPLLRKLRAEGDRAAGRLHQAGWPRVSTPGLTLHLGEEFHHPLHGLRNISVPFEAGLFRAGDRIGHGLALGPGLDSSCHGQLSHCITQLLDLVWERSLYLRGLVALPTGGRLRRVESRIERLVVEIWPGLLNVRGNPLRVAEGVGDALLSVESLTKVGWFGSRVRIKLDAVHTALFALLNDPKTIARGLTPVMVPPEDFDPAVIGPVRRYVRQLVADFGITIEANPNGNHLIGDFDSSGKHPALMLAPVGESGTDHGPALWVSVNTDDPITFATNLEREWAYLYTAVSREGIGMKQANSWLQSLNEDGWRSRFTTHHSYDKDVLAEVERALSGRRTGASAFVGGSGR